MLISLIQTLWKSNLVLLYGWNVIMKWRCELFVSITCVKYFGIFNHISYKITLKLSKGPYYAFIYSKIKNGIRVYGSCSNVNINEVQIIQNELMKYILRLDPKTPTNELHRYMNILIYKRNILSFLNEILAGRCPKSFKHYFQQKGKHVICDENIY